MEILYDPNKGDFGLELSLDPYTECPADAFQSMADLIRAFDTIDRDFAQRIDLGLDPRLVLQTIEIGTLRTWFASVLRSVPDEALSELDWKKAVGFFLVKAKYELLKWLDGKETVNNAGEVDVLRNKITELKNEVERLRRLPVESPVPLFIIVMAVKKISDALIPLPSKQNITYISPAGALEINRSFSINEEQIQDILTSDYKTNRAIMPLIIKKPDYLGTSMWEVVAKGRTIKAKIVDEHWLDQFHNRRVGLLPGDALLSDVRIDAYIDEKGKVFDTRYTIEQVNGIVRDSAEQTELFNGDTAESKDKNQ